MGLAVNRKLYQNLKECKKLSAISFLATLISRKDKKRIKIKIKRDPEGWFALYHHGWGTCIRNALREVNYGEKYFGINNLDDIYVELVEDMIERGIK